MVAADLPGSQYVITTPNMGFIPFPGVGYIDVRMRADARFGAEDPIQWPQVYCDNDRYCFLCCVPRLGHRLRPVGIWSPPIEPDFVAFTASTVPNLWSFSTTRISALGMAVRMIVEELEDWIKARGEHHQIQYLILSTNDAWERLSFPSTKRDLRRQYACLERFYCMSVAWLVWYGYWFTLPNSTQGMRPLQRDLMGAFTTDISIAQKLYRAGIPVWLLRREAELCEQEVVENIVDITMATDIVTDYGEYAGNSVYVGTAGHKALEAILYLGHRYLDVEALPFMVSSGLPSVVSTADTSELAGPSTGSSQNVTTAARADKQNSHRQKPCKSSIAEWLGLF